MLCGKRSEQKKFLMPLLENMSKVHFAWHTANFSKALIRFPGSQFLRASLRRGGLKLVAPLILSEADYRSEAINRRTVPLTWPLSH